MKCFAVSQVYTIISFGASIGLWAVLPTIAITPSMNGMPLYSIHSLFTTELFLNLSISIVWITAIMIFLYNSQKQSAPITKSIIHNFTTLTLAIITILVALSGFTIYSQIINIPYFPEDTDLLPILAPSSPNPLAYFYGYGILFCEGAWIIIGLSNLIKHLKGERLIVNGPEAI